MSDKVYDVPAEWKKRAYLDDAKYQEMYAASISDPDKFWGEQAKRIDWMKRFTKVKNTSFAPGKVSIKWFEDGTLNAAYNCIDRHLPEARETDRDHLGRRRPERFRHITYQELHDEVCRFANIMRGRNGQEGRPRHDLHADDPGGRLRDARLRAHRRDPFGDLRRLLARLDCRPHRGLQIQFRHHRRRRAARRPQDSAQSQCRRGDRESRRRRSCRRRAPHRRAGRTWIRCATSGTTRPTRS